MRRRLLISAAVVVGALGWLARGGRGSEATDRGPLARSAPVPRGTAAPPAAAAEESNERSFAERAGSVSAACDLPLHVECDAGGCVSLLVGPDLDGPAGWLGLVVERPRFVLGTALRDLGLPPEGIPCGSAIASFGAEIGAVELADGTEVWCAADDLARAAATCDRGAEKLVGRQAARFGAPGLRRLAF